MNAVQTENIAVVAVMALIKGACETNPGLDCRYTARPCDLVIGFRHAHHVIISEWPHFDERTNTLLI
jgi:hypothetical protein